MTDNDQLTRADLAKMSPEQIDTARLAGRFDDLMANIAGPPRRVSLAQHASLIATVGADEAAALLARLGIANSADRRPTPPPPTPDREPLRGLTSDDLTP